MRAPTDDPPQRERFLVVVVTLVRRDDFVDFLKVKVFSLRVHQSSRQGSHRIMSEAGIGLRWRRRRPRWRTIPIRTRRFRGFVDRERQSRIRWRCDWRRTRRTFLDRDPGEVLIAFRAIKSLSLSRRTTRRSAVSRLTEGPNKHAVSGVGLGVVDEKVRGLELLAPFRQRESLLSTGKPISKSDTTELSS